MKTAEELQKELDIANAKAEENIKALQKKLSDADVEKQNLLAEKEALEKKGGDDSETTKQIKELTQTVETLSSQIGETKLNERKVELAKKYPDIEPEFLIGKTDEECEKLALRQREKMESAYGKRPSDHEPIYKDRDSIDAEIQRITDNKSMKTEEKMKAVRELKLKRQDL